MFASAVSVVARRAAVVARPQQCRAMSAVPSLSVKSLAGADEIATSDFFKGSKVLVVGVVGAFTSVCDGQVPAFADAVSDFKAKGVDKVAIVTVNDPVVTKAWKESLGLEDELTFFADWDGSFTKAVGQDVDLSVAGLGVRSNRYAMLVDDGNIVSTDVEAAPGELKVSSAEAALGRL